MGTASNATAVMMLAIAAFVDIRTKRIPDMLILFFAAAGLLYLVPDTYRELPDGLLGGLVAAFSMFIVYKATRGGLGFGDVKLFGCTGVYLGFEDTLEAMLVSIILCGLFSLILMCINRENGKRELPFAPFILAGALEAMFL